LANKNAIEFPKYFATDDATAHKRPTWVIRWYQSINQSINQKRIRV